ncbi:MAG: hypothetical protein ABI068_03980 [Ktedonobacterales bacterium]
MAENDQLYGQAPDGDQGYTIGSMDNQGTLGYEGPLEQGQLGTAGEMGNVTDTAQLIGAASSPAQIAPDIGAPATTTTTPANPSAHMGAQEGEGNALEPRRVAQGSVYRCTVEGCGCQITITSAPQMDANQTFIDCCGHPLELVS